MSQTDVPIWDYPTNPDMLAKNVEFAGKRVVDVGAGAGELVRFMRDAGADPIGVECGTEMIRQAREADPDNADRYVDGVGQDLPLPNSSADMVVFSYSLHHVPGEHLAAALREVDRVLHPGGTLVVLEPIAEGPGFETHRLVDDETEVRGLAQRALDNDLPASMRQTKQLRYTSSYSYEDFDELAKTMTDIDSSRREIFEQVKDETRERFHQYSVEAGDRYWFSQPVLLRIFEKS